MQNSWPSEDAGCYIELFRDLGEAIRKGKEPLVKWEEAIAVIEMIELSHRSANSGTTVVVPPTAT